MKVNKENRMKRAFSAVIILVFILFFSFMRSSYAIYQWVDEKGQVHITDYPKPSKDRGIEEKESPVDQTEVTAPAGNEQVVQQPAAHLEKKEPVQPQPSPAAVQPLAGTQVKRPAEPAPQMPAQQSGKQVVPPVGQAVQPVPIAPMLPTQAVPQQAMPPSGMPSLPGFENGPSPEMLAAMLAGFMSVILIVSAVFYFYSSLCLFLIAKKLDVPAAWLAWIPIIQVWTFFQSAGKSLLWILLFFIPFVNLIVAVYLWMCIAENLGKNKWLGLLTLVPIANLILPAVLAFSKKEGMATSRPAMA
jgi:hypothetical protein